MAIDLRLAKKGKSEPLGALSQQGRVSLALALKHAADLDKAGWSAEDSAGLEGDLVTLEALAGGHAEGRGEASLAAGDERKALSEVKGFLRKLRNALPRALRETKATGVTAASFYAGEPLGRSTPKHSHHLTKIRPFVMKLDEDLTRFFGGESASAKLDEVKTALDVADTTQETKLEQLPVETQKLYELKGRVLEQIEDLNRAGKTAYDGQAERMAKFNQDVLLRGRKTRKAGDGEVPAPEPAGGGK